MVLIDTGAETSIIYGDPTKFQGDRVMVSGFVKITALDPLTQMPYECRLSCEGGLEQEAIDRGTPLLVYPVLSLFFVFL